MRTIGGQLAAQAEDTAEARAIAEARWADPDAIHFLYARYANEVVTLVSSLIPDQQEAEDVTQAVFEGLHGAIQRYELRNTDFGTWLLQLARNAALEHLEGLDQDADGDRIRDVGYELGGSLAAVNITACSMSRARSMP
jgi:RNA polymerase sigma-70 factor (ECF subfamily)